MVRVRVMLLKDDHGERRLELGLWILIKVEIFRLLIISGDSIFFSKSLGDLLPGHFYLKNFLKIYGQLLPIIMGYDYTVKKGLQLRF